MENKILEISNLTKYYGKTKGVKDLSLSLSEGEIFGFIGPNGAGKSTTIRCVMDLINKNSGKVIIDNEVFKRNNIVIKKKVGYLPSEINLYDDLTVKKLLNYHEEFYGDIRIHAKRIELVERLQIDENKKIEDLSLGNLKKVGIILALMHSPKLLILDEPTSGLDPIMQNVFYDLLKKEKERGATIFYSTHILSEVSKICDRVGIIRDGELIKIEKIEDLKNLSLTHVTIKSNYVDEIVNVLNLEVIVKENNTVKLKNTIGSDSLIKCLAKYPIDYLLIEEASLEDIFMHYYE